MAKVTRKSQDTDIVVVKCERRRVLYYAVEEGELRNLSDRNDEASKMEGNMKAFFGGALTLLIETVFAYHSLHDIAKIFIFIFIVALLIAGFIMWKYAKDFRKKYQSALQKIEQSVIREEKSIAG